MNPESIGQPAGIWTCLWDTGAGFCFARLSSHLLHHSMKFSILASHWNHPVTQTTPQAHSREL